MTWEPVTCTPKCLKIDDFYGCTKITGCGCYDYDGFPVEVKDCPTDERDDQQRPSRKLKLSLVVILLVWYSAFVRLRGLVG